MDEAMLKEVTKEFEARVSWEKRVVASWEAPS